MALGICVNETGTEIGQSPTRHYIIIWVFIFCSSWSAYFVKLTYYIGSLTHTKFCLTLYLVENMQVGGYKTWHKTRYTCLVWNKTLAVELGPVLSLIG